MEKLKDNFLLFIFRLFFSLSFYRLSIWIGVVKDWLNMVSDKRKKNCCSAFAFYVQIRNWPAAKAMWKQEVTIHTIC
jgi:hypothetical protein